MQRLYQLLFVACLLALSWFAMMAVHELGHAIGALISGGSIVRVVLHPLAISRTDVIPNPHPAVVVWLGPIIGCVAPLGAMVVVSMCTNVGRYIAQFFAGFCLIANGAYISIGWIDQVGDCGEMIRTGTPIWAMLLFGAVTIPIGLLLWHRLGSIKQLIATPSMMTRRMAFFAAAILAVVVVVEFALSPR
jgi:hypothetical protein